MQILVNLQEVADFRKSTNWGSSACRYQEICSEWQISENLQTGGDFCMQISGNLQQVADSRKSANGGEFCLEISQLQICFLRKSEMGGDFYMQISGNLQ